MVKCICDICCAEPATEHFKIKKQVKNYEFGTNRWERIDICSSCYHKLIRVKGGKQ